MLETPERHEQPLSALRVWFHFPVALKTDPRPALPQKGWVEQHGPPHGMNQYTYFHRFVAEALWGKATASTTKVPSRKAAFDRYRRDQSKALCLIAERNLSKRSGKTPEFETLRVHFRLLDHSLWIVRQPCISAEAPGLAILAVQVDVRA